MRKPVLALAICGAVLLVPLALAAPGVPGAGEEVVLAAGSSGPPEDEGVHDQAADLETGVDAEVDADAEVEVETETEVESEVEVEIETETETETETVDGEETFGGPSTTRRKARPKAAAKSRSTTATTSKARAARSASAATPATAAARAAAAQCESGNTNDPGAPYYGYWQFSAGTWRSMGQPGLPNEHSRAHQLVVAKQIQAAQGWAPWPDCSRRLGLR